MYGLGSWKQAIMQKLSIYSFLARFSSPEIESEILCSILYNINQHFAFSPVTREVLISNSRRKIIFNFDKTGLLLIFMPLQKQV